MSWSVYKLGELARRQQSLLKDGQAISHRVVSNCIAHNLFSTFITIIIISSFAVLSNCLYLIPQVLGFFRFPPHPTLGESERLHGA